MSFVLSVKGVEAVMYLFEFQEVLWHSNSAMDKKTVCHFSLSDSLSGFLEPFSYWGTRIQPVKQLINCSNKFCCSFAVA